MRVRTFTQDDAHIFMLPEQVNDEIKSCCKILSTMYIRCSDSNTTSSFPQDRKIPWGQTRNGKWQRMLSVKPLRSMGVPFVINEGDGAFYGPKLDFHLAGLYSAGHGSAELYSWICRCRRDLILRYVGSDGEKHRPDHDPPCHLRFHRKIHRYPHRALCRKVPALAGACTGEADDRNREIH